MSWENYIAKVWSAPLSYRIHTQWQWKETEIVFILIMTWGLCKNSFWFMKKVISLSISHPNKFRASFKRCVYSSSHYLTFKLGGLQSPPSVLEQKWHYAGVLLGGKEEEEVDFHPIISILRSADPSQNSTTTTMVMFVKSWEKFSISCNEIILIKNLEKN